MPPKTKSKPTPKPVAKPVLFSDIKKYGTEAQQRELNDFVRSLTPEQVQVVQALLTRLSTGACFNGDGTIDAEGLRTTGGYRKSIHYLKAYFAQAPQAVTSL